MRSFRRIILDAEEPKPWAAEIYFSLARMCSARIAGSDSGHVGLCPCILVLPELSPPTWPNGVAKYTAAVERYTHFLALLRDNPGKAMVPSLNIDLCDARSRYSWSRTRHTA